MIQTNYKNKNFCQNFPEHKLYVVFASEEFRQFGACPSVCKGRHISFGHDNNVMLVGQEIFVKPEKFSDESFDSVSFDCIARFLCYCNSQPSNPLNVNACYYCKMFRTSPHPLIINCLKPVSVSYPFRFPVRLFLHAY